MAPRNAAFLDATHLLGPGWQSTILAQTERGDWFITIRHGSHGLEASFHGGSGGHVLVQAGDHVRAVASRLDASIRRRQETLLRARPPQEFDMSSLPLFSDASRQVELF